MILAATLQKHLIDEGVDENTRKDFLASLYVDDSVWSENSEEEVFKRKDFCTKIFRKAGMNFREWTSNSEKAQKLFGEQEEREPPDTEKVLGMRWNVITDEINVNPDKVSELLEKALKTKRDLWKLVPSV